MPHANTPFSEVVFTFLAVYLRWIIGGTLVLAGGMKSRRTEDFVETVEALGVVPPVLARSAALAIILAELVVGTSLIVGIRVRSAAFASLALFLIFTVVVGVNLLRRNIVNCGCFGPYFGDRISHRTIVRNLLLAALSGMVLRFDSGYLTLEQWFTGYSTSVTPPFETFVMVTAFVLIVIFALTLSATLLVNRRRLQRRLEFWDGTSK